MFDKEKVEEIINKYKKGNFQKTGAKSFSELILKFYSDCDDLKKFDLFANEIEKDRECYDIVMSQRCKLYAKQLEYRKLKDVLKKWKPEESGNRDPLHILSKISALLVYENFRFEQNQSDLIVHLFEEVIQLCNSENQLKYFAVLYYRFYLLSSGKSISPQNQELFNGIELLNADDPQKYIDVLCKKRAKPRVIPNSKARYQETHSFATDNMEKINQYRLFNFFEYTSLPMVGIFDESDFANLIKTSKDNLCDLMRMLPYAVSYFGHDSDEDF